MPGADKFMDKEANENELKQVIGDTHASYQLSPDDEVLIVGRNGMVLCSKDTKRLEPQVGLALFTTAFCIQNTVHFT
jgi:hypothetical protein